MLRDDILSCINATELPPWERVDKIMNLPEMVKMRKKMDCRCPDIQDIIAWADGVLGTLGTEYASRVTDYEATIANAIISISKKYKKDSSL